MKIRLIITTMVLALATAGIAMAGHGHGEGREYRGGHENRAGGHMGRMARHLDLSESQQEQIRATMEAHGPQLKELQREIRQQRKQLRSDSGMGFNEEAARAQTNVLGELTAEAAFVAARMHSDVQALLTDEQRQQLAQRQERPRGGMHWRHRRGHQESVD